MSDRRPLLIGKAETIDLLRPDVRSMLDRQGIYLASDIRAPGITTPLVVSAGRVHGLQLDTELDPERFNETVRFAGPFYAPGEVHGEDAATPPVRTGQLWQDESGRARVCGVVPVLGSSFAVLVRTRNSSGRGRRPFLYDTDNMLRGDDGWTLLEDSPA